MDADPASGRVIADAVRLIANAAYKRGEKADCAFPAADVLTARHPESDVFQIRAAFNFTFLNRSKPSAYNGWNGSPGPGTGLPAPAGC